MTFQPVASSLRFSMKYISKEQKGELITLVNRRTLVQKLREPCTSSSSPTNLIFTQNELLTAYYT